VSTGKITGEEDRYSGTDLWDFAANVEGSEKGFELLEPAIEAEDPDLVASIEGLFDELEGQLGAYRDGEGYQPYSALTDADKTEMQTTLADLSENLATVAGVLGLEG
jgi:iron uptake system component EfeO